MQQRFGRDFTVELFGSARYGVDDGKSDLDLVILVSVRHQSAELWLTLETRTSSVPLALPRM